jgi:hypothetical protein
MSGVIRRSAAFAVVLVLCVAAGCNRGPQVVRVTGTVKRNNQPVSGLMIHFYPEEGRRSWGFTDAEGRYELEYDRKHKGALVGSHKVVVKPDAEVCKMRGVPYPAAADRIVAKYGDLETTPLRYEVKADGQVIDIDLE